MIDISELIKIYTNEKSTNDLLPYNSIVEIFSDFLSQKRYEIEKNNVLKSLSELEHNRINFFVKEYFLIRLSKIRYFCKTSDANMSDKEKVFYKKYYKNEVFKNEIDIERKTEYVGFVCKHDIYSLALDDQIIDLKEGYFYIANIKDIYLELLKGNIKLM